MLSLTRCWEDWEGKNAVRNRDTSLERLEKYHRVFARYGENSKHTTGQKQIK